MKCGFDGWMLWFGVLVILSGRAEAQLIYDNTFDHYPGPGIYTEDNLDFDWFVPEFEDGVREERVAITTGLNAYRERGSSLAVLYPFLLDQPDPEDNGVGPKVGGAQWPLELPGSYDQVRASYRVKFAEGFDFVRGGKLPGLAGGTAPTGSDRSKIDKGWTARFMWRNFDNPNGEPRYTANLIQYLKHPTSGFDGRGKQEDEIVAYDGGEPIVIESGRWYRITQLVKMNTPGRDNGRIKVWVDGDRVLDIRDLEFRTNEQLGIDAFYFSTFFGGGDATWAPSKDEVIYFDDFEITVR